MDTELLLALLESSLPPNHTFEQSDLLEALVTSGGDVSKAVESLTHSTASASASSSKVSAKPSSKRKASDSLDGWIKSSRRRVSETNDPSSSVDAPRTSLAEAEPSSSSSSHRDAKPRSRVGTPPPSAFDLLKDKDDSPKKVYSGSPLPPLRLATPDLVSKHTPTTLHTSIFPPEFACELYYFMLNEAKSWTKNKWYLNDRLVESPHTTSFYSRLDSTRTKEEMEAEAKYWYNGRRTGTPRPFPDLFEQALLYLEPVVRDQMKKRKERFDLEYGGDGESSSSSWSANVAAANCYRGSKQGVGPHADHLTYLGPYPTIASISLGTTRLFRLREVIPIDEKSTRQAQTFDIPLPHNSLLIMHPPTQERFKHSIPTVKSIDSFHPPFPENPGEEIQSYVERINITFRFFRPDYRPSTIPTCKCYEASPSTPSSIPSSTSLTSSLTPSSESSNNSPERRHVPAVLKSNMKRRGRPRTTEAEFYWQCNAGAQNDGDGCKMWKAMDARGEGRGPFWGDLGLDLGLGLKGS